jgi:hypothetical protein
MSFPIPDTWSRDTAEFQRDEEKRRQSPCSFFFSQGRALVLAAGYFNEDRLTSSAKGGVAGKHRHRIQLSLFGQLMAAFEYMLKDFISQTLDACDVIDDKIKDADWVTVGVEQILSQRSSDTTVGSLLVHPTMGWHYPIRVNNRFETLYGNAVIEESEIPTLERMWIIRHSVAHNAGFVTSPDAARFGSSDISEEVVNTNRDFMSSALDFLTPIAKRTGERCGKCLLHQWMRSISDLEPEFRRDEIIYKRIKYLGTYIDSRPTALPALNEDDYLRDYNMVNDD